MALYESVLIARQDVSATTVDELADQLSQLIADNGGAVTKKENWGLRNLSYKIKKNRKGHYVFFNIDAPTAAIAEMERTLRFNEDVIRYLTVRVEKHEEGPSAMMERRDRRDGGRGGDRRGGGFRGGPRRDRRDS